jgi:chromosome partitioning protein
VTSERTSRSRGTRSPLKQAGASLDYDWLRYLVTRFEPGDGPQAQMESFMRSMFGEFILCQPMLKSVAISDAGMTKQTLYEVDRRQFTRGTYDRAMECLDAVHDELEHFIRTAWGREIATVPPSYADSDGAFEEVAYGT